MMIKLAGAIMVSLTLAGCSIAADLGEPYDRHDAAFRQQFPQTIHRIIRDGHGLHAREFQMANKAAGPPIVLMHGFPDSLHLYDRLAPLLAEQRRVVAFDFLGWGRSDKPEGHRYSVESLRCDLEAVIAHFGFRRVVLVVHDASGPPGIDWAIDNPSRMAGLVLLNTLYAPSKNRIAPPAIERFSSSGFIRELLVFGAYRSDGIWQGRFGAQVSAFFVDDAVRKTYLPIFVHQALGIRDAFFGLTAVWRDEIAGRAARVAELRGLRVPTKIIFGTGDPYLGSELAREFHGIFPNSTLHLVRDAGHYVQLDKPVEVARHILSD